MNIRIGCSYFQKQNLVVAQLLAFDVEVDLDRREMERVTVASSSVIQRCQDQLKTRCACSQATKYLSEGQSSNSSRHSSGWQAPIPYQPFSLKTIPKINFQPSLKTLLQSSPIRSRITPIVPFVSAGSYGSSKRNVCPNRRFTRSAIEAL